MLPVEAETLLDRTRTDWFPEFLSHGKMHPHFQPIVDLRTGLAYGREALMRGKLGAVELRGAELLAAAEAHDAIFSFDYRARTAALEVGLPLLPPGEILFVNLDPRASLDVESSLRTTWPVVGRLGADPSRLCLEFIKPERCLDRDLLHAMAAAHRKRGAKIALDDLSGGPESLACLELMKPDIAKIDTALTAGIQHSAARRRLVAGAGRLRARDRRQGRRRGRRARRRVPHHGRARRRPRPGLLLRPADGQADGRRHPPRPPQRLLDRFGGRMASERDLFANFERMRREMDELFGDVLDRGLSPRRRGGFSPAVDVYYVPDPPRAVVRADLAGIDPSEVSLEISGRELILSGHRDPEAGEDRVYQQLEIEHGPFRRVVSLGADVDVAGRRRPLRGRRADRRAAAAPPHTS